MMGHHNLKRVPVESISSINQPESSEIQEILDDIDIDAINQEVTNE